jgi:hypothetical protein
MAEAQRSVRGGSLDITAYDVLQQLIAFLICSIAVRRGEANSGTFTFTHTLTARLDIMLPPSKRLGCTFLIFAPFWRVRLLLCPPWTVAWRTCSTARV